MSEDETIPMLEKAVGEADAQVQEQQRRSQASARRATAPSRLKEGMALILLAVAVTTLSVQFPRFSEPYSWPDTNTHPSVAEADLNAIAAVIETYRVARGNYPNSLDDVRFPDGLRELLRGTKLRYQVQNASFTLDWVLPRWHAVYDGSTGLVKVEKASATR